jgi:hypothetical protein
MPGNRDGDGSNAIARGGWAMNQPTPNSPEFAKLTAGEQRNILEDRAIEAGTISYADLFALIEEPEEPKIWITAAAEAEALKRWRRGQATPAYTLSAKRKRARSQ